LARFPTSWDYFGDTNIDGFHISTVGCDGFNISTVVTASTSPTVVTVSSGDVKAITTIGDVEAAAAGSKGISTY
jgi:hypothetical protein